MSSDPDITQPIHSAPPAYDGAPPPAPTGNEHFDAMLRLLTEIRDKVCSPEGQLSRLGHAVDRLERTAQDLDGAAERFAAIEARLERLEVSSLNGGQGG